MPGRTVVVLLCVALAPWGARASDTGRLSWSGTLGIASDLVYRGIKLNEELLVPDLDLAVEHASGFYLHGWLTRVDLPQPKDYYHPTDTLWQTLIDVGYTWRTSPAWTVTFAHGWYRYSGDWLTSEPDYREWIVSVDYRSQFVLDYAHTDHLWGLDEQQDALSLGVHWSFSRRLIGAGTVGWIAQEGVYDDQYHYLRLNLGYLLKGDWSIQLQLHESFGIGDPYHAAGANREWVARVNWHW